MTDQSSVVSRQSSVDDSTGTAATANPHSALRNPQSVVSLAGEALRLYLAHWRTFLGPVVVLEAPVLLLTVLILTALDPGPRGNEAQFANWLVGTTIFTLVDSLLIFVEAIVAFLLLALIAVQVRGLREGTTLTFGAALRLVGSRLGALLGGSVLMVVSVGLLTVFGVTLTLVFTLVLAVLNADPTSGGLAGALQKGLANPTQDLWAQLLLLAAVSALSIFLVIKWSLMVQAVMLEDAPPVHALRRSWVLVRGYFWRTLALLLLASLPISLLSNGTTVAGLFDLVPAGDGRVAVLALSRALGLVLRLLVLPWTLTLMTLYYYDLRQRHAARAAETSR
jgi:hypothetical protein